jgi:hypothetical protein
MLEIYPRETERVTAWARCPMRPCSCCYDAMKCLRLSSHYNAMECLRLSSHYNAMGCLRLSSHYNAMGCLQLSSNRDKKDKQLAILLKRIYSSFSRSSLHDLVIAHLPGASSPSVSSVCVGVGLSQKPSPNIDNPRT